MTTLLVTGSRNWHDLQCATDWLWEAFKALGNDRRTTLVVGDAAGVDEMCAGIWRAAGMFVLPFKANWRGECRPACGWDHRKLNSASASYCPAAGMYRNQDMVDHVVREIQQTGEPALCLELRELCEKPRCRRTPKPHWSHGAEACAEMAEAAGITTWRVPA